MACGQEAKEGKSAEEPEPTVVKAISVDSDTSDLVAEARYDSIQNVTPHFNPLHSIRYITLQERRRGCRIHRRCRRSARPGNQGWRAGPLCQGARPRWLRCTPVRFLQCPSGKTHPQSKHPLERRPKQTPILFTGPQPVWCAPARFLRVSPGARRRFLWCAPGARWNRRLWRPPGARRVIRSAQGPAPAKLRRSHSSATPPSSQARQHCYSPGPAPAKLQETPAAAAPQEARVQAPTPQAATPAEEARLQAATPAPQEAQLQA